MEPVLQKIRAAQWRWDWIAASHGAAFHAPEESGRVLGAAIDIGADARIDLARILADLGVDQPVPLPDMESKAALQAYIGLDMDQLEENKLETIRNVISSWDEQARRTRDARDHIPTLTEGR